MKIWNSKYALTSGLLLQDGREVGDSVVRIAESYQYLVGEGKEWHRTYEEAAMRAEQMRDEEVGRLAGEIARLKAMSFDIGRVE